MLLELTEEMPTEARTGFAELERAARPILELIQHLTGLETSFVTEIDWTSQQQEVVLSPNTSELQVAEGSVVDWSDSMCRWTFLTGVEQTDDVIADFPGSLGGEQLGMRTFVALPILDGGATIGTVCGASRRSTRLEPEVIESLRLLSKTLSVLIATHAASKELLHRAERAEALALVDPLTGLANRRAFTAHFEEALARSGRHATPLAVVTADLDHFKAVNDTYGHPAGDLVLVTAGETIRQAARAGDLAARLGGDEFALLLPGCDAAGAAGVAARICEEFARATESLAMPCSLSIGIGSSETGHRRTLLADADAALYQDKARRRDRRQIALQA